MRYHAALKEARSARVYISLFTSPSEQPTQFPED